MLWSFLILVSFICAAELMVHFKQFVLVVYFVMFRIYLFL